MIEMSEGEIGKEAIRMIVRMIAEDIHPIELLKETVENKDWFKGLILSTTFFEMFGLVILDSHFRHVKKGSEPKIVTDFLDRLGLMRIIQLLYLCGFIELGTYTKMNDIVKERNKWIHRKKRGKKDFAYLIGAEQTDKEMVIKLIESAIDCLKELGLQC